MAVHSCGVIEFVGGPLDGHTEVKEAPLAPYIGVKTMVARRASSGWRRMLRKAGGLWRARANTRVVPLAVYELDVDDNECLPCYRYIATQAVSQQRLDDEHGRFAVLVRYAVENA
jgi:hypothetical protein